MRITNSRRGVTSQRTQRKILTLPEEEMPRETTSGAASDFRQPILRPQRSDNDLAHAQRRNRSFLTVATGSDILFKSEKVHEIQEGNMKFHFLVESDRIMDIEYSGSHYPNAVKKINFVLTLSLDLQASALFRSRLLAVDEAMESGP